jgi:hypothetical protein
VRFQAIGGQVGVVTWFGLAALPESEIFFEQEEGRQKRERAPVFAVEAALCCRSRMCRWAIARPESKKIFRRGRSLKRARQVYNQKLVYRIVVIVNGGPHLWIRRVLSTRSTVYAPHKPVGLPCIFQVEKMDKKLPCAKSPAFAQSVPVDMQKLIHSPETLTIW